MSASEIKYVYAEWESKGQAKLLPYALQYNYEEIDSLLKDMDNIAQDAGLGGIGYRSQESDIAKLAEWAGYLNAYINSVIPELQEQLDRPLYLAFNHHATEDLSRIRMEDYTTENKLGIKRRYTVSGIEGMPPQELVKDTKLSMEDFLGLTGMKETGEGTIIGMPKAFRDFTDMFAVDYNLLKDELKTQDGKEVTLEEYLLSLKSAGEFSHKMDKPVLEFISAVLDVTAVKPLIECCTGYDMITGEDLSDFERGMKAVSGLVSLFTLGQGSIVMNGGKLALGESVKLGAKILAVDAVSTGVAYGTSEICQAMGCPGGLTLVLSMLAGMGTSAGLGSKVFGNGGVTVDDLAYQRYLDEGVSGTEPKKLLDNAGKFNDEILESKYQDYLKRKLKRGKEPKQRLEWKQASDYWTKDSPIARGNKFNKTVRQSDLYDYHEVYLSNGKRLDSYDPDIGGIISRKATDLDKISEDTFRKYLSEFRDKYSRGTEIRSNAYPELDGLKLDGQYILEIPASNANIKNIEHFKDIAKEYDVILRFTEEIK